MNVPQEANAYYGRGDLNALKNYAHLSDAYVAAHQGCVNSGRQVVQVTKFRSLTVNSRPSARNVPVFHSSGACNFQMILRFLENLWIINQRTKAQDYW